MGYEKAEFETAYSKIISAWKYENEKIVYSFEISEGTTAYVTVNKNRNPFRRQIYKIIIDKASSFGGAFLL